jgi:hypothetical protein
MTDSSSISPASDEDRNDQLHQWMLKTLQSQGMWGTLALVTEMRREGDLKIRGYAEILRAVIVRDFLSHPQGMQAVPKLTADFLNNFDKFNLSAQEGYLVSLIDGRLDLHKLLLLSPFDHFATMFNLARLEHQRAITVPR